MGKVYVICSLDTFLLEEAGKKFINEHQYYEFNIVRYNFSDSYPLEIINELQTVSLLGDEKLIIISYPEFLKTTYRDDSVIKLFSDYLSLGQFDNTLLILADFMLEQAHPLTPIIKKVGEVNNLKEVKSDDIGEWINNYLANQDFKIEERAIHEIIERTGNDMLLIHQELAKLMLYADDNLITYQDVITLVSKALDDNIFNLLTAFINNDKKKLLAIYNDFMVLNEDEMRIIGAIANKLEEILYTKTLLAQGLNKDDIAGYFKVKPGRAYYMIQNAKSLSESQLLSLIDRISKLDGDIKSGKIDKKLGLELFLLGFTSL